MMQRKLVLISVVSFLLLGIFGCELPGDTKGGPGPTGTGGGDYQSGGGGGYQPPPPPPTPPTGGGYNNNFNNPPIITDVHPDMNMIGPGGRVRLFANAYDPEGSPVSFRWNSPSNMGFFSNPGPDAASCDWNAPPQTTGSPSYELICEVRDQSGLTNKRSVWININFGGGGANYNQPPMFDPAAAIVASKYYEIKGGEIINLSAFATDPNPGDVLNYMWNQTPTTAGAPMGMFNPGPNGKNLTWTAPVIKAPQVNNVYAVYFDIGCRVEDGHGGFDNRMISISVLTDTTLAP